MPDYKDPFDRVPYFYFKEAEMGEDLEKSKELGYAVPKLVTVIYVTPHGHKGDPLEFIADDYIERKEREARGGFFNPNWVREYKNGLAMYKEGRAMPRSGTPMISYERILKSRREALSLRYPTVEDLAAVPDSSLSDIGLDGRVLRDLAKGDIQSKKGLAPVVRELADAKETIRRQEDMLAKLTKRLDAFEEVGVAKKKVETA